MCATSGLLHGYAHKLGGSSNLLHARFIDVAEQRLLGVTLNGQTPKFLHPDKETYRYLGIGLSLSMNWEKQKCGGNGATESKHTDDQPGHP